MGKKKPGKIIEFIVNNGKIIEKVFILTILISLICAPFVKINYDLTEYLPSYAPSKEGLEVMKKEFGYPGTARIMIGEVSIYEAKELKDKIEDVDGVDMVLWLDSTVDVYTGSNFIENEDIKDYYNDNFAVMDVTFEEGDSDSKTHEALSEIQDILGDKGYYSGSAVDNKSLTETLGKEISLAMVLAVIFILIILCIATNSWLEPFLFLLIMGIAIIINMGTNIFLGTISFFTFSVAAILQLAIAMDYSIFLLHAYQREKEIRMDSKESMEYALKVSISSILSSGATTIVGFIVLAFMKFSIGFDMGVVLAKGIVISLFTVLFLMPTLILRWDEKIKKTEHKPFVKTCMPLAEKLFKVRHIIFITAVLITIPSYVGQGMSEFLYGNDALGSSEGTQVYEDAQKINEKFGRSNLVLALVPNGMPVSEKRLTEQLEDLNYVKYAKSLMGILPEGFAEDFLPKSLTKELRSENYARILISIKTAGESDLAFNCTKEIDSIVKAYYPKGAYVVGVTPSTIDIKEIITTDYSLVNIFSLIGVAVVIFLTFKSLIIPIIVIIPIEMAIFINMAIPYITGNKLIFMGYIIVSCLQLGATIDYSILVTNNYMDFRAEYDKKRASVEAVSKSLLSVLTSGLILTTVGYGLSFTSTVSAIASIGELVGRGAILSTVLVLTVLPILLTFFDKIIFNQKERLDKMIEARRKKRKEFISKFKEKGGVKND